MHFRLANWFNRFDLFILVIIILVGLVSLPKSFTGDHALATIMASKMSRGEIIYHDLWDIKQPGIFCFYLIGGSLFGFNEIGIHIFELFYMTIFSVIMILALKGYFKNRSMASLVPLMSVGIYYGVSGISHQTQTEALVGFPMFLSLWYAVEFSKLKASRRSRLFLSGFIGGVVLIFKFAFLPILTAFWLSVFIYEGAKKERRLLIVFFQTTVPIILGVLIPLLILFGYFASHKMLSLICWTFFEYPLRIMSEISFKVKSGNLINGLLWFMQKFSPLIALGTIGAYTKLRNRRDLMTLNLVLWLVIGFGVILFQYISWWEYHYLLLFVPLGILGTHGLDFIWTRLKGLVLSGSLWHVRVVAILSVALLFYLPLARLARYSIILAHYKFAIKSEHRLKYQSSINDTYRTVLSEVAFLSEPESFPGKIYVFGNPLYYYLSEREPAIPLLATWFTSLPEQWIQLMELLNNALPPYIFVGKGSLDSVRNYTPNVAPCLDKIITYIEKKYRILRRSDAGTWYVIREKRPFTLMDN